MLIYINIQGIPLPFYFTDKGYSAAQDSSVNLKQLILVQFFHAVL